MRISDWSSDVCSSDLLGRLAVPRERQRIDIHLTVARVDDVRSQRDLTAIVGGGNRLLLDDGFEDRWRVTHDAGDIIFLLRCSKRICPTKPYAGQARSEEHTSELKSLMRNSYAVFCLKKK